MEKAYALLLALSLAVSAAPRPAIVKPMHGLAMHGDLKYGPDFKHFEYVNPSAPKGGRLVMHSIGTFDTLNSYTMKGNAAAGLRNMNATLAAHSQDEPFSIYCYLCESMEVPANRSWAKFTLRKNAKFHDGTAITADDVIFSFETLKTKGHPFYRQYYKDVLSVVKTEDNIVKFIFQLGINRELPLIISELPVFSKKYWANRDFTKTTLEPPLGSGPYKIKHVDAGRSITYERVKNWWGENLSINKGRYNFDEIKYVYFRDETVAMEAFKAGDYDLRFENTSKTWATAYTGPAIEKGLIKKLELPDESPDGMQGFQFNTRRQIFKDRQVRKALDYALDFEWTNKALMYNAYRRSKSFWNRSELASSGLPAGEELTILKKYRGRIPEEVFSKEYNPPTTDGSGDIRNNLRQAIRLLRDAGWKIDSGTKKLVNDKYKSADGGYRPMEFEILLISPGFERLTLPFAENLKKLGITAHVRTVDDSQFINRLRTHDFDMIVGGAGGGSSPGNEQRAWWHSENADQEGSVNYSGVKDPVLDELVELVIAAPDRKSLVTRTHALDRVLLWGHYFIPQWYVPHYRIAFWDKFSRPIMKPKYASGFYDTIWLDAKKEKALKGK